MSKNVSLCPTADWEDARPKVVKNREEWSAETVTRWQWGMTGWHGIYRMFALYANKFVL